MATKMVRSGGSAVVAGCVHATTPVKLALVDSVDQAFKKLPIALRRSDGGRHAVPGSREGSTKCRNSFSVRFACSRRMRRRSRTSWVSSKKLEIITNDERLYATTVQADALRTRARNLEQDNSCGGKRTGAKVMATRAKPFRGKITFLKRPRQAARWRGLSRPPPSPL